jgi:hypothetical protein
LIVDKIWNLTNEVLLPLTEWKPVPASTRCVHSRSAELASLQTRKLGGWKSLNFFFPSVLDLEDRWATNLNEDGKDFVFLQRNLTLAPNFSNTSPHRGKTRVTVFLQWSLKAFTVSSRILRGRRCSYDMYQSISPGDLTDLLGGSTSIDVDVDRETELKAYTRVQEVPLDTEPLMWWNCACHFCVS